MTPKQQYYENIAATLIKNLARRQMEGFYCRDKESAVRQALA
ncbi:MAG: lactate utilization protein, partial [Clostridiales bacterium]|nr:lactate utilization protein [Clostridiales bacterium]